MTKIDQKITGYSVVKPNEAPQPPKLQRTETLAGTTYKIKTPLSEHALYVTINNQDGKPFEIFINSKAMDHFQWVIALTRLISAVFRHGGEVGFLIDELRSVFDPKGGYFKKGRYMPSLVAEIGEVIETHLISLGLYAKDNSLADAAVAMVEAKREKVNANPSGAVLCDKCNEVSMVLMDGCQTCLSCGNSKCG